MKNIKEIAGYSLKNW